MGERDRKGGAERKRSISPPLVTPRKIRSVLVPSTRTRTGSAPMPCRKAFPTRSETTCSIRTASQRRALRRRPSAGSGDRDGPVSAPPRRARPPLRDPPLRPRRDGCRRPGGAREIGELIDEVIHPAATRSDAFGKRAVVRIASRATITSAPFRTAVSGFRRSWPC